VRNLKTNFYTYAGVVKALDGVSFDMWEGETLGLVGETGCGKSVTALSILRLIPQPPGKIEEGEVLFDVPEADLAQIEALETQLRAVLPKILGNGPSASPSDLSARRLRELWSRAHSKTGSASADLAAFRTASVALLKLKEKYDLLSKSDEDMRTVRGNRIAMIFQDPMQALNPVFPIGDQIAENILLHQRQAVLRALIAKMELEEERDAVASTLDSLDPQGAAIRGRIVQGDTREAAPGAAWSRIFKAVEGDFDRLSDVRDWIAGSSIAEAARENLVKRMDKLIERANRVLLEDEPISGHFARFLPRRAQLSHYRRMLVWSPSEVMERLLPSLRAKPPAWAQTFGFDQLLWKAVGAAEIRIHLPKGTDPARALEWIRRVVNEGKSDPAIGSIRSVAAGTGEAVGSVVIKLPDGEARGGPLRLVPFLRRRIQRPFAEEGIRWAVQMLRRVKISDPERIARQYPYELSGGMQQRALIAIALSCNPRLLIADEPTTALDVTIQAQILELIREMKVGFGSSVLIITHDLGIIAEMCNRVCVMYAGHIAEDAAVRAVFKSPLHPYTQGLMKAIPSHAVRKDELEIITGSVPNLIYPPPGCRFHPRCPAVMPTCGWSPSEVADHLKEILAGIVSTAGSIVDINSIGWKPEGSSTLHVLFPEGTKGTTAAEWIRKAVNEGKDRPALRAVVSVEPGAGSKAVVKILEPRKPPEFEVEPKHYVTCLLFEEGLEAPLPRGGRSE